ncbi:MAG: sterol desaturase family protein [Sphingomonadales bacterium]|nr:MAG: sterol desaturase family protein [Sphingomonadales bacterium]TNF03267.1 MAG: sterol desaturase family protein [Sphingomonadales bacterium]
MQFVLQRPVLALIFLILALGEYVWRRHASARGYDRGQVLGSLGIALGQAVLRPVNGLVILSVLSLFSDITPWQFPIEDWRTWVVGFFAVEFAYYWFHRTSHRVRWLWATHSVHHSATQMVFPAAIRLGWTGIVSGGWLFFAALVLVGFPPIVVTLLHGINLAYQYLLHTEAVGRLGMLEWVLNTPSHHRAHHSRDSEWLDCNFGGMLILFDRLFGTFRAEPEGGGLRYGLVHGEVTNNPFRIAFAEWRRLFAALRNVRGWRTRAGIAFGPPE